MKTSFSILPEYGCAVRIIDKSLQDCPLLTGGALDGGGAEEYWGEVTAPQSQSFLDAVNRIFGTHFEMKDFPGR